MGKHYTNLVIPKLHMCCQALDSNFIVVSGLAIQPLHPNRRPKHPINSEGVAISRILHMHTNPFPIRVDTG